VDVEIRRARTGDVPAVRALIDIYAPDRRLLSKATVVLYEDVPEFFVAVDRDDGRIVGCGALHVLWADLAEVRTLAVDPSARGQGIGGRLLERLVQQARDVGVSRIFCLTFETGFFARYGFAELDDVPVEGDVKVEMLQSHDEGVAEFLDLARVKPNTLGNTRLMRTLH
jgi:amino-acid N-acetyltransferase